MPSTPSASAAMRQFWDRCAREDPWHFIDNRRSAAGAEPQDFWRDGEAAFKKFVRLLDVPLTSEDVVLEIGCGIGRLTRPLAAAVARVVALDVSPEMIERATAANPGLRNVEWRVGDGVSLNGVADASVDGCLSFVVFQHLPDAALTLGYIEEMGRVLRPGGWTAFHVSSDPSVHVPRRPRALARIAARWRPAPWHTAAAPWMGSAVSLADVEATAGRARLRIDRVYGAGTQFCLILAIRLA